MALDMKYGKIDIPGIPEDEPVFILRAQDSLSELTISEYQTLYVNHVHATYKVEDDVWKSVLTESNAFVANLRAVRTAFVEWQASHADSVKAPD